ncbi:hypothetical protein OG730_40895 [Streptomyces sp. NBC_01298]|uniref:hypothetical protein n=1 Tax=Streptomyces sp. NBC_01298 TaxID=2903817 RepID=UPI002E0E8E33|nr:hypothetical protein OG730_40895 [Streptomyces sp. NBC_01298]
MLVTGRLGLAGPVPALFETPAGVRGLTLVERTPVQADVGLVDALAGLHYEGTSLACVAVSMPREARGRLEAAPATAGELEQHHDEPWAYAYQIPPPPGARRMRRIR